MYGLSEETLKMTSLDFFSVTFLHHDQELHLYTFLENRLAIFVFSTEESVIVDPWDNVEYLINKSKEFKIK